MVDTPAIVDRPAQPYVFVTQTVTMDSISEIAQRIPAVIDMLAARGVTPSGASFLRYRLIDMDRRLVVEAGVPTTEPVDGDDSLQSGVVPAGSYATLVHRGHPAELADATTALLDWADELGHRWDRTTHTDGDHWGARLETFPSDPSNTPVTEWVTEIAIRLEQAGPHGSRR